MRFRRSRFVHVLVVTLSLCVAWLLWFVPDWGFLRNEITVYQWQCKGDVVDDSCTELEAALAEPVLEITFRMLPDQSSVVAWGPKIPAYKTEGCTIVTRTNWSCGDIHTTMFGFRDGRHFRYTAGTFYEELARKNRWYYLQRAEYLRLHYLGF